MRNHILRRIVGGVVVPVMLFILTVLCAQAYWGIIPAYLPIVTLALVTWGSSDYRRPARSLRRV